MISVRVTPRAFLLALAGFLVTNTIVLFNFPSNPWLHFVKGGSLTPPPTLPTYHTIRQYEKDLPQHNLDLPFPEGRSGRYVRFNIQPRGQGWNNVLNERYASGGHH